MQIAVCGFKQKKGRARGERKWIAKEGGFAALDEQQREGHPRRHHTEQEDVMGVDPSPALETSGWMPGSQAHSK